MSARWWKWWLIGGVIAFCLAEFAFYYPRLPNHVASHFNTQGQVFERMAKEKFAAVYVGCFTFLLLVLTPMCLIHSRLPKSLIHLPHKEYWFAPNREATTRASVGKRMDWIGVALLLQVALTLRTVLHAQLKPQPKFDGQFIYFLIIAFIVFSIIWFGEFFWRFGRRSAE
jgi:uncharacterized membrane protein